MQSMTRCTSSRPLRVLLDSVPAQVPWLPFMLWCPSSMDPVRAATRTGALASASSMGVTTGMVARQRGQGLMDNVRSGGGRVWVVDGGHADLSPEGLSIRLPIYVDFIVHEAVP